MLIKPARRVCPGQSTAFPISAHDPFNWIKYSSEAISCVSIDGFIVDGNEQVSANFIKYELPFEQWGDINFFRDLLMAQHKDELRSVCSFSQFFQASTWLFIWPMGFPAGFDLNDKLIFRSKLEIRNDEVVLADNAFINLDKLSSGIARIRGRSFKNVKPLLSASSNVECYLANNTPNPWPGDLDGVLVKTKNSCISALIEFKTHNKDTPIRGECIGKYGDQDWRRFKVLFDMQRQLKREQGFSPRLYYIVWGTRDCSNHSKIKIDVISPTETVEDTIYLPRPPFGQFSEALFGLISQ